MFVSMTTDTLMVYLTTLPTYEQTNDVKRSVIWSGEELLRWADTLPETDQQRVFIIYVVYVVARVLKTERLLEHDAVRWLEDHLLQDGDVFGSEHFKNTVLSSWELWLRFMTPFLLSAGVTDIEAALEEIDLIQIAAWENDNG